MSKLKKPKGIRSYQIMPNKKHEKELEKRKIEDLNEKEQLLHQREEIVKERENKLKYRSDLFDDTIHEINKIYKQIEGNTSRLKEAFESLRFDDYYLNNTLKTLEGNVSLLSIRLELHRYLMNPSLTESDQPGRFVIYKKVEKIYKCLYEEKAKKSLNIDLKGSNERSFRLKNTIELAIFIIIENAIKYSPENETITINFSENTNGLIVTFKNWAICPTDDEMQKLTERGYRSSIIRQKTNINGSGLGLYLLKQLCQSNNVEFNISKGNELKMISGVKYNPFIVTLTFRNA
jgi:signal transduction histidine kinase